MSVMEHKRLLKQSFIYAAQRSRKYPINLISWVLADFSMYFSMFLGYLLMSTSLNSYGTYSSKEMLLYLSCYYVVNNLFAVFFTQGLDIFCDEIWSGLFVYALLSPVTNLKYYLYRNINIPALLSTIPLFIVNLICLKNCNVRISLFYIVSIILSTISMVLIFAIIFSLQLYGIHSFALSSIIVQFLSLAEKPDTIFSNRVRYILTFIIPVFIMSAIPCRIALNKYNNIYVFIIILVPIMLMIIFFYVFKNGVKKYHAVNM
ncbi:ABC-2 family transporter protein [Clostridium sp. ATCC 25772]|uniref:ABC-2 family transporter protein n=1 Tax=Clostridium sp. ATCC 25772 TaxID=1676991 RepID=UPI0007817F83|nr:ABC-2 family transporter protein [Clostridium sp. ATCC 25772]